MYYVFRSLNDKEVMKGCYDVSVQAFGLIGELASIAPTILVHLLMIKDVQMAFV